jgi:hypothetical protein
MLSGSSFMPDYNDIIDKHASRVGIDPSWLKRIMKIESGGNPNNTTGSYKGLFQLDEKEFKRGGGTGSIYDPEQNTMAAANVLARNAIDFKNRTGRDPTLKDMYMIHQQGAAGYASHLNNPDKPAWMNFQAASGWSEARAKKAIWGNIPDNQKAKYGSVENVTSKDFTENVWGSKIEGTSANLTGRESETVASYKQEKARREAEGLRGGERAPGEPEEKPKDDEIGQYIAKHVDFGVPDLVPRMRPIGQ